MVINKKDKYYVERQDMPNENWIDDEFYLVDSNSELAEKIKTNFPNFDFVLDDEGNLIDITPVDPPEAPIEEIVASKLAEIKKFCEANIIAGTDADVLDRGMLHYSLTETKQDDIKSLALNIQNGAEGVLWHDDSRVMHEFYTAEQFMQLYKVLYAYIITCKITSDGFEQYAVDCANNNDIDTLKSITWGTELPEYIQIQVDQQIALMLGTTTETE